MWLMSILLVLANSFIATVGGCAVIITKWFVVIDDFTFSYSL